VVRVSNGEDGKMNRKSSRETEVRRAKWTQNNNKKEEEKTPFPFLPNLFISSSLSLPSGFTQIPSFLMKKLLLLLQIYDLTPTRLAFLAFLYTKKKGETIVSTMIQHIFFFDMTPSRVGRTVHNSQREKKPLIPRQRFPKKEEKELEEDADDDDDGVRHRSASSFLALAAAAASSSSF
jgi:hypothetical protein